MNAPQTGPTDGTIVTFARGGLSETAQVVFAGRPEGQPAIVTNRSPFHPQSLSWPDQPGDRGRVLLADGQSLTVIDSHEALMDRASGTVYTGAAAQERRRQEPALAAVVLHLLAADSLPPVGATVTLQVDADYRAALSLQHTGVHLAALALNRCAAAFWTKDPNDNDCLGLPNLDKAAVVHSGITADQSTDGYRLGKSLRKKGFDRDAFLADLPQRAQAINDILRHMLTEPAPVLLTPVEGPLGERRLWSTRLNGLAAAMPCGGTHVAELSQIGAIAVALEPAEDGFTMITRSIAG